MTSLREFGISLVLVAFVSVIGCSSGRGTQTGNEKETPGSVVGQTPATVTPVDSSFGTNTATQQTPGLAPSSPDGSQLPGLVDANGYLGNMPLQFLPGQLPQSLLPGYNFVSPTFSNPNILRFFLCIALVAPYNQGITSNQIIEKWNLITSFYIKLAGRLPRPAEMRDQLRLLANVDAESDRQAAAWRLLNSDEHLRPLVSVLYQTFLRRAESADEEKYWITQIRNGMKYEAVVIEVAASSERRNLLGGNSVDARIDNLVIDSYAKILGRQASTRGTKSERGYWRNYVNQQRRAGKTLPEALKMAVSGIVKSDENRWKVAEHLVKSALEDASTWTLINTAFGKLKANDGDLLAVMKWVVGSQPYFEKFKKKYVANLTPRWCEDNAGSFFDQWF